tara:strand:+ start:5261 stop:5431 length:171 start_codon:yes stop_codon:yes gene_type:complete
MRQRQHRKRDRERVVQDHPGDLRAWWAAVGVADCSTFSERAAGSRYVTARNLVLAG